MIRSHLRVVSAAGLVWASGLMALAGCGPQDTRINLVTYDEAGEAAAHYTDFRRASFRTQSDGKIELVLRTQQPSQVDPSQTITQVVYVQMFWNPVPGVTYMESTQINARVQYALLTPPTGMRYDGGAFVTYKIDKQTHEAVGYVESGDLAAAFQMGEAAPPFGPARIYGHFRAKENPADVVDGLQTLAAQFVTPAK